MFKRCGCRDPRTRRLLGRGCRKLRRPGGGWSPHHGSWSYQLELPPTRDGKRRSPLRRGGFGTQTAAEAELTRAQELLAISTDRRVQIKIADLIVDTLKTTRVLPDPDTVRRKVRTGQDINRQISFGDWLEIWLKGKKRIRDGTRARYASDIKLYLGPYLGHIEVEKLRVADLADMFDAITEYNDLIREARSSGDPQLRAKVKWRRPVNPPTMRHIQATARHALNVAIKQERLIDFNPAAIVELPPAVRPKPLVWTDERVRAFEADHKRHLAAARDRAAGKRVNPIEVYFGAPRPSPVMVWTALHTRTFLDYAHAHSHRLYPLYRLIALRGLRRGEACGARRSAHDRKHATLGISWQITMLGWQPRHGKPKTAASDRTVALDAETNQILTLHAINQDRDREHAGLGEAEFFFTTPQGDPVHPAYVTDQFQWLVYQAGLPPIRLHDLRHGAASLMLAAGVDIKIVQETLGHVTSAFTRDTYTSVYPELAQTAAENTAALIRPHNNPA
jgi:integrase